MSKFKNLFSLDSGLARTLSILLYIATGTIAISVLIGWHTQNAVLIQIFPNLAPMQYNTALCFLFISLSGLLSERAIISSQTLSYLVLIISTATLIEYGMGINLYIDNLVVEPYITVETSHPGRMAPNTALCFLLSSVALSIYIKKKVRYSSALIMLACTTFIAALCVVALGSYVIAVPAGYGWGSLTKMALHTTISFILFSCALIPKALRKYKSYCTGEDFSLPIAVATAGLSLTILFWTAVTSGYSNALVNGIEYQSKVFKRSTEIEYNNIKHAIDRLILRVNNKSYASSESLRLDVDNYIKHISGIAAISTPMTGLQVDESKLGDERKEQYNKFLESECRSASDMHSETGINFSEKIFDGFNNTHMLCFRSNDGEVIINMDLNRFLEDSMNTYITPGIQVKIYNEKDQNEVLSRLENADLVRGVKPIITSLELSDINLRAVMKPIKGYIKADHYIIPFLILIAGILTTATMCFAARYWAIAVNRTKALEDEARLRVNSEKSLEKKSQTIQLIYDVCSIAFNMTNEKEDLHKILHIICEFLKIPVGHIYRYDEKHQVLKSDDAWFLYDRARHRDFVKVTNGTIFDKGVGLPGRIWSSRKPAFISDLKSDKGFIRGQSCTELTLVSGFGFPIFANGEILAVFEFFNTEPFEADETLMDALNIIGEQISRSIDRLNTKEILAHSEERNRQLLENAAGGILGIDSDGKIIFFNKMGIQLLGYNNRHELIGSDFFKTITHFEKEDSPIFQGMLLRKKVLDIEKIFFKANGKTFPVLLSASPIIINNEVTGAVVLFSDLTTTKENEKKLIDYAEQLKKSNVELDDFAHITSHDLKEPLRGLSNYASFLLEDYKDKIDSDGVKMLEALKRLTARMDSLLTSLLNYSRVGRVEMAIKPCNLAELVHERTEMISHYLKEHNAHVHFSENMPIVACDETKIGEVIYNLILNGVKYNLKEEKNIHIDCLDNQSEFIVSVKDNGIGIPEKHYNTIFTMFKRLHGKEEFGGGSGSGLTISRRIVERHGGKMWVKSEVDVGTTFYLSIPKPLQPLQ